MINICDSTCAYFSRVHYINDNDKYNIIDEMERDSYLKCVFLPGSRRWRIRGAISPQTFK